MSTPTPSSEAPLTTQTLPAHEEQVVDRLASLENDYREMIVDAAVSLAAPSDPIHIPRYLRRKRRMTRIPLPR